MDARCRSFSTWGPRASLATSTHSPTTPGPVGPGVNSSNRVSMGIGLRPGPKGIIVLAIVLISLLVFTSWVALAGGPGAAGREARSNPPCERRHPVAPQPLICRPGSRGGTGHGLFLHPAAVPFPRERVLGFPPARGPALCDASLGPSLR